MTRHSSWPVAAAIAVIFLNPINTLSASPSSYDGTWRIHLQAAAGSCPVDSRVDVSIDKGQVRYGSLTFAGGIDSRGSMSIRHQNVMAAGVATGRLSQNRGAGTWKITTGSHACHGSWNAQRL